MIRNFLPLCLTAALATTGLHAEEAAGSGQAVFTNGDRLSGTPSAMTGEGLVWTADHLLHQPSTIKLDSLLEVRLQGTAPPKQGADHQALLKLTNGDTLSGELTALTDDYVTLNTWYSGELQVKRTMAADLEIIRSERSLYSGPNALTNWSLSGEPQAWSLANGTLVSRTNGSVARKLDLPDKCRISFDLAWRASLKFRFLMFSDEGDTSSPDNCYEIMFQRQFVYMRKRWSTNNSGGTRNLGQNAHIRELANQEKVRLDIYFDRSEGTIAFYVDGRQAQVWSDEDPKVGDFGSWFHFVSEEYPLQVSNIRASAWVGDLPENDVPDEDEVPADVEGQVILLQNGDTVIGEVGAIQNGILNIKTEYGEVPVPVQRMRTLDLSSDEYEEPIRKNGDVRAWLREGGRITFRLDSFKDGKMEGFSQTFGKATFDLSAFSRVEFNIYDEEIEHLRSGPEW